MSDIELASVLRKEFSVSAEELDLAMRHAQRLQGSLHMVLWQYGLITLEQLDALLERAIGGNRNASRDDKLTFSLSEV